MDYIGLAIRPHVVGSEAMSNYRIDRHVIYKVPRSSMNARGAHAER